MRVLHLATRLTYLAAILLALPLSAAEIFVANNGDDITGDGSIGNAYKTESSL